MEVETMSDRHNSATHESIWVGVQRAIEATERFDAAWPLGSPLPLAVISDVYFRTALRRDLAWTGRRIQEA
jgi:hypothetical protein